MFIKTLQIKNFRLFSADEFFTIDNFNIPDGTEGSGINVFVGENACGKSTILEAISLPVLDYKAESILVDDLNDVILPCEIRLLSSVPFEVKKTVPRGNFKAVGFEFKANIRSRSISTYLSSMIVSDQRYIQALGEGISDTSPDLRSNVNNPFSGTRFSENDFLFLDKNRTNQTKCGTYNKTRFDRLMQDFDYQYIKDNPLTDTNNPAKYVEEILTKAQNGFLIKSLDKFKSVTGKEISLEIIDNLHPFKDSFIAEKLDNQLQIKLSKIGSGYEMFFSLIYSFYMSEQSGRNLILIIDEPELHLHPSLQKALITLMFEISKSAQIFLSTHSPLLIKQLCSNPSVKIEVLKLENSECKVSDIGEKVLPIISANEINYIAFNLPTNEYHNELYGHLHELYIDVGTETERPGRSTLTSFDAFLNDGKVDWIRLNNRGEQINERITLHSCIRNKYHHPENCFNDSKIDFRGNLQPSIEFLREKIIRFKGE